MNYFKDFWSGAPLFLNITVILALVFLLFVVTLFTINWFSSNKRKKALISNYSVASQSKDFDPKDDNDPNRPMAIIRIKNDKLDGIAGPIELFKGLPHVTNEVVETLRNREVINLFDTQF